MQYGNSLKKPVVAIWMVTYNQKEFITDAVESVMKQETLFPYMLYIGEDFSTDGTRELCIKLKEKYPDKINLLLNEQNLGPAKNALEVYYSCIYSGAKYIALLEGDDYWTDNLKLQKQVDFLEANISFSGVGHNSSIFDAATSKTIGNFIPMFAQTQKSKLETKDLIEYLTPFHTSSFVFHSSVVQEIIQRKATSQVSGDIWLYFTTSKQGFIGYIDEVMSTYRINEGGVSNRWRQDANTQNKMLLLLGQIDKYFNHQYSFDIHYGKLMQRIIQTNINNNQYLMCIYSLFHLYTNRRITLKQKISTSFFVIKYIALKIKQKINRSTT